MHTNWYSRNIFFLAAAAAVLCGLLFMNLTGAPPRLLLINLVALGVGIALVSIAKLIPPLDHRARSTALLAIPAALLATALLGVSSQGASRWVLLGGLSLQPSLILVPVLLLAHVSRPSRHSAAAVALAALAMALQPDRSVAAAIAAVTLADAALRRSRGAWAAAFIPLAAFGAAMLQPDRLPAVPFVDAILWTADPLAATAVWIGTVLLFVPVAALWRAGEHASAAAFAALWATLVISAGVAFYPTPLVGYGASGIIGYLLAALAVPGLSNRTRSQTDTFAPLETREGPPASLLVGQSAF